MIINDRLIDKVREEAKQSPRLRMNYNFHERPDAGAQRMLNSLLPGTEIPIHRHPHTAETYILLDGHLKVNFYNDQGEVTESFDLHPYFPELPDLPTGGFGIHIPAGQWHGLEVLVPSTIFEVKDGPYTPITPSDILHVEQ